MNAMYFATSHRIVWMLAAAALLFATPARSEAGEATQKAAPDKADEALARALAIEQRLVDVAKKVEPCTVAVYNQPRMGLPGRGGANPFGGGRRGARPPAAQEKPAAGAAGGAAKEAEPLVPRPPLTERIPALAQGGGSGVIISADGYILTNHHVVAESARVWVGLATGERYWAAVLSQDVGGDLAMLRIEPKEGEQFPFARLGDSDALAVGDFVVAAGNPFMLSEDERPTVTFGVVSALHRYQGPAPGAGEAVYGDAIQVDAAINPGNSGGPLFDMNGDLLGINGRITLRQDAGRANIGVGFTIPINQIKNIVEQMKTPGMNIEHGFLGVRFTSDQSLTLGGAPVESVTEGGPSATAGIRVGDVIVRIDGQKVANVRRLVNYLSTLPAGREVTLTVRRPAPAPEAAEGEVENGDPAANAGEAAAEPTEFEAKVKLSPRSAADSRRRRGN